MSGRAGERRRGLALWVQVRDVAAEVARLADAGVPVVAAPVLQPRGLLEATVEDPDGLPIVLVEVPAGHPLRTDVRPPG